MKNSYYHKFVGSRYNTGLGKAAWVVDVITNKMVLQFCLDDQFNKTQPQYRTHLMQVAVNFVEKYCEGLVIDRPKMEVVRKLSYAGGDGPAGQKPVVFTEVREIHEFFLWFCLFVSSNLNMT